MANEPSSAGWLVTQILSASGGTVALLTVLRHCLGRADCSLRSKLVIPGGRIRVTMGTAGASTDSNETSVKDELSEKQHHHAPHSPAKESGPNIVVERC